MLLKIYNAGKFISHGGGNHLTRVIQSDELIVVLQGELEMFEDDHKYLIRTGEWLFLQHGKTHGGIKKYPKNLSFFWIHFKDSSVFEKLPRHGELCDQAVFANYIQCYLNEQSRTNPDKKILELLFKIMLREIARKDSDQNQERTNALTAAAKKYMSTHFQEPLSLNSISSQLHCNPRYLSRLYRQTCGVTIFADLNKIRIRRAMWLLAHGNISIKETAQLCGFNDTAYFRRQFRSHCSMTPKEFRRQYQTGEWNTQ